MKLSEAMRQGWQGIEQCTCDLLQEDADHTIVAACALGAAYHGVADDYVDSPHLIVEKFPELFDEFDPSVSEYGTEAYRHWGNPTTKKVRLLEFIYYLNDTACLGKSRLIEVMQELGY